MRKRPIGQILVEKNEISEAELAAALAEQERTGLRLGQILIETGRISWLALARAIAEQVLDIEDVQPEPTPPPAAPAAPAPLPPAPAPAAVVAWSAAPASVSVAAPAPEATWAPVAAPAPLVTPAPAAAPPPPPAPVAVAAPAPIAPELIHDPEIKLHSVEALLKERQRAFIELVTTTETLRMKVAHLEEIIDERDRELTKLRVMRAS
jgi:hypothetical protein